MVVDRYTKMVLTVIAVALAVLAGTQVVSLFTPGTAIAAGHPGGGIGSFPECGERDVERAAKAAAAAFRTWSAVPAPARGETQCCCSASKKPSTGSTGSTPISPPRAACPPVEPRSFP